MFVIAITKTSVLENSHFIGVLFHPFTFEWVIECLVSYCGHDSVQAEQCATLVHYTGKCEVKKGELKALIPICETLLEKGLSAEIN